MLAAGAPVSTPDIHGGYPLHYAAQMCGGVCIKILKAMSKIFIFKNNLLLKVEELEFKKIHLFNIHK